jgi:hypothetical protein
MTRECRAGYFGSNYLYSKGLEQLFAQPEFIDGSGMRAVGYLLDNLDHWLREAAPTEPHNVYIGAENPIGKSSQCSLIISRFRSPYSDSSYIGVLGPTRQSYRQVMNLVKTHSRKLRGGNGMTKKPTVKELTERILEIEEDLKRAQADAVNIRRRSEQDKASIGIFAKRDVVTRLLPVIDNLDRAIKNTPDDLAESDYVKGSCWRAEAANHDPK